MNVVSPTAVYPALAFIFTSNVFPAKFPAVPVPANAVNKLSNASKFSGVDKFSDVISNGSCPATFNTTDFTPSAFNRFLAAVATPVPCNAVTEFIVVSSTVTVIAFPFIATSNLSFADVVSIVLYASFTNVDVVNSFISSDINL